VRYASDKRGRAVVEEHLDVVLGFDIDVQGDACAIFPAQKAAALAAVVLDRSGPGGDLKLVPEPLQSILCTEPCLHLSFWGARLVQVV